MTLVTPPLNAQAVPARDCSAYGTLSVQKRSDGKRVTVKSRLRDALPLEAYNFAFDYTQYRDGEPTVSGAADGAVQTDVTGSVLTAGFATSKKVRTKFRFILANDSNRCVVRGVVSPHE